MPKVNILVLKYPLFKNTNPQIQQKKTHQRPLLAPHGAAGGVGVAVGQAQRGKTRTVRFGGVSD